MRRTCNQNTHLIYRIVHVTRLPNTTIQLELIPCDHLPSDPTNEKVGLGNTGLRGNSYNNVEVITISNIPKDF
jgi:hypothetical protein